jgi:DNA-binding response OmpR family regulator
VLSIIRGPGTREDALERPPEATDLIEPLRLPDDAARARASHEMRATAFRIRADCERMLEDMQSADRTAVRQHVTDAFIASRELVSLTSRALQFDAASIHRLKEPQRRVLDAVAKIQRLIPTTLEDELLQADVQTIRDAALTLLRAVNGNTPQGPVPGANPNGSGARILVVDDEALLREILRRQLTELGHEVLLANNGRMALEIAERERPDVVVSDINMPEVSGIDLLRLLKKSDTTREIPVIVVSAQDDVNVVAECIDLGAEDHITKPFHRQILQARVRASLERKRSRDLEITYLHRVRALTEAAEAVERDAYVPGSLTQSGPSDGDELGTLARVFDRVVTGLKTREVRLQRRLSRLREELGDTTGQAAIAAVTRESPFASGDMLAARYEILGYLGKGGMGTVYHARDLELGEEVAVKVVRRDLIHRDASIVDRLKQEIRLSRKISHRNVVRVHDLGDWKDTYFITMEFVRGLTVEELINRRGCLSIEATLAIGTQLAEALAVAHEQQIIHRDIKPGNLLVDDSGVLKVMDFGIARSVDTDAKRLTEGGFIVGTPEYMPPEQLRGRAIDARADLFAAGIVLYECLAGTLPFSADSPADLLNRIESGTFVELRQRRAEIPERLESLVHQQLQARPADRARSARALAEELAEVEHARS